MSKDWESFTQARTFARGLGLRNWHAWMKTPRPEDIPSEPFHVYSLQWKGWRDWLGTEFRSFEDARAFVRTLKIKSYEDWQQYCKSGKKPRDIRSVEEAIQRLAALALDNPEIKELDINPLIVNDEGGGCFVADARIML